MSCFVMKPESIAAISEFTADLMNMGYNAYGIGAPKNLFDALQDCRGPYKSFEAHKIYQRLYALNLAAYEGRYAREISGEGREAGNDRAPDVNTVKCRIHQGSSFSHQTEAWHYRMAKLLKCYNYQVAEDATAKDPLTLSLRDLERDLDEFIVSHSPEFEQAPPWGQLYPEVTAEEGLQRIRQQTALENKVWHRLESYGLHCGGWDEARGKSAVCVATPSEGGGKVLGYLDPKTLTIEWTIPPAGIDLRKMAEELQQREADPKVCQPGPELEADAEELEL